MLFVSGLANAAPILESTGVEPTASNLTVLLQVATAEPLDGMKSAPRTKLLSAADGLVDGMMAAEQYNPSSYVMSGFVSGVLLSALGAGLGQLLIGPTMPNASTLAKMEGPGKGQEYQTGFIQAWKAQTVSKKKSAFLGGSFIGTVIGAVGAVIVFSVAG